MAKILLVDDDAQLREMLREILELAGHQVRGAKDGRVALALYRAERADLVLTDLVMPEKEGLETIRELLRHDPRATVIAMSGGGHSTADLNLTMAEKLGARDTLPKPFSREELLAAVERALG
jgi:DNA-binding NtrC family response regulator